MDDELKTLTVLYVEDEAGIRENIGEAINRRVRHLYLAANGQEGLQLYVKHRPEIVITDIRMPLMSGLDMAREIKKLNPKAQIIITTAFSERELFLDAINIGVNQYVLKPINRDNLLLAIYRCMEVVEIERKFRESQELFRKLSQGCAFGVGLHAERFIYVNPAMEKITGYTGAELLELSLWDVVHPNWRETVREQVFWRLKGEKLLHEDQEMKILTKWSDERWIRLIADTVEYMSAFSALISVIDVTAERTYEREIRQLNKTLEGRVYDEIRKRQQHEQFLIQQSKMASMGEMIGVIAHQWRQPLNNLNLIIQDLEVAFGSGELDKVYLDSSVNDSINQIDFMTRAIDTFRDFLRPSKKKEYFEVKTAVTDTMALFEAMLKSVNIKVCLDYSTTDGTDVINVLGYPNEFKQVIFNILNNAKDAIVQRRHKYPHLKKMKGSIAINISSDNKRVVIGVSDNGGGIDNAIIGKVFDPYFTTKEAHKGTGIGMYMSRTIVETNMNGRLDVKNIEDGALFTIELCCESPTDTESGGQGR
ncbi:multi-sensor signal transduction histidine kinase [Candidatus Magnetobacterium bavaricum]|uniref:histidine kinase n=1 Tax=Candidatus Magnetobacterium bavaricum TaxID=29290 RepID=A0A0F3GU04_9BACT|nr:multi-sensor signal transduction histidine kinase [Candidatus Magnetobacterium bavaricum]